MKKNRRLIFYIITTITTIITVCVCFGLFNKKEDDIMNWIVSIVAIISGLGSVLIGISSIFSASLDNVREYYATGDTKELSEARKILYNYRYIKIKFRITIFNDNYNTLKKEFDDLIDKSKYDIKIKNFAFPTNEEIEKSASLINNFFQMWGLLQSKGFLPMWVFETASGYSIIKLFEATEDIIDVHKDCNPFYGDEFKSLCCRINKNYKKSISKCKNKEEEYIINYLGVSELGNNEVFNSKSIFINN